MYFLLISFSKAACMVQAIDPAELPPDASTTLYLERLPQDVTKRELAHIFRPFEGYAVRISD